MIESYAVRVLPIALAAGPGRLWAAEAGGRVAVFDPLARAVAGRFAVEDAIADLEWISPSLWILGSSGSLFEVDPDSGATRSRRDLGPEPPSALASRDGSLWTLDPSGLHLRPVEGREDAIRFSEPVRAPTWTGDGAIAALWVPARAARPGFRWRGLAPGPDPARPGPGGVSAILRLDPRSGAVLSREPLAQEAVALAWQGDSLWYAVHCAEGLERSTAIPFEESR